MKIPIVVLITLVIATLACEGTGVPGDTAATLDAAVQQTVSAEQTAGATPRPSSTPLPPTPTEQPAINVTLQYPTDTPLPPTNPPATNPPAQPTTEPTPAANLTRPNGSPVHAARLNVLPTIDCSVSEWVALPNVINQATFGAANWLGEADQSATYALGWDANNLYLAAHVVDDKHVQIESGENIFKGDSLEILLDTDLGGDYDSASLSSDDYQLGLSPGANKTPNPAAYLWFPRAQKGQPANVNVTGCTDGGEGYFLEAAMPWAMFGVTPAAEKSFGFAFSSSDNDTLATAEQQSMISSVNTRRLINPTTWGTLILDP